MSSLFYKGHPHEVNRNPLKTIPVEELLGKGITSDDLNDDVLLRTLDATYDYGVIEPSNEIVLEVMRRYSLGTQPIHVFSEATEVIALRIRSQVRSSDQVFNRLLAVT